MSALFWLAALAFPAAAADVYIGVEGPAAVTQAIGLPPFVAEHPDRREEAELGHRIRSVLRDDLLASRYFKIVEPPSAAAAADPGGEAEDWRKAGAGFALAVKLSKQIDKLTLTASLLDFHSGEPVLERYYRQDAKFWRSLAHRMADDIVRQLTGKTGIAHTQIAFVNNQTGHKEVYLIDYDGEGLKRLTADRSTNLLPRWSPDGRRLLYTSYKHGNPDLFEIDLGSGLTRALSERQGLNIAGGFSPDGSKLVLTLSKQKNPNLYQMNMADLSVKPLTSHFGVDTSPTYSPDGAQIAFASDRSGNPQIHILEPKTGKTRRLTRLNWCDSPSWSPTGEWIVFSGRANPKDPMDIFLVDITGSNLRQLTHGEGTNEDPSWSPDGRFIAFTSTREGRRKLYWMDADGSAPHAVADIPGSSFTPSWSP